MPTPCEQKDAIDKITARLHLGDVTLSKISLTLTAIKEAQIPISEQVHSLHNRMFIDNGKKSFQSSLSNIGVHIRLQWFFIGAIVIAVVGGSVKIWMSR